jgi:TRAP-type C4-dicarboxylate transport system permease small subunit
MLNRIYSVSAKVATWFLALVAVIIVAHIVARVFGTHIPSADEFAAWAMAASFFLALPDALFKGIHIRVTLLLQHVPLRLARALDIFSTSFALALLAWAAWYILGYTYDSYAYDVRSQGILPTPLWIPQTAMAYGACLMAIGFADRLQRILRRLPVVFPENGAPNDGLRGN